MATHRFWLEVEVQDDHENADDAEWWADAAAGACDEYGSEEVTYHLEDPAIDTHAVNLIAEMLRDPDWGSGMLEDIAEIVTAAGRDLSNPSGESTWDRH